MAAILNLMILPCSDFSGFLICYLETQLKSILKNLACCDVFRSLLSNWPNTPDLINKLRMERPSNISNPTMSACVLKPSKCRSWASTAWSGNFSNPTASPCSDSTRSWRTGKCRAPSRPQANSTARTTIDWTLILRESVGSMSSWYRPEGFRYRGILHIAVMKMSFRQSFIHFLSWKWCFEEISSKWHFRFIIGKRSVVVSSHNLMT